MMLSKSPKIGWVTLVKYWKNMVDPLSIMMLIKKWLYRRMFLFCNFYFPAIYFWISPNRPCSAYSYFIIVITWLHFKLLSPICHSLGSIFYAVLSNQCKANVILEYHRPPAKHGAIFWYSTFFQSDFLFVFTKDTHFKIRTSRVHSIFFIRTFHFGRYPKCS